MTTVFPNSVLVIGAAGYIGLAVAKAFRQQGYFVYGLIRNNNKATLLQSYEIIPVVGDVENIEGFKQYIKAAQIVIDCTGSFTVVSDNERLPLSIIKAVEEASKNRDKLLPPKTYIYTSGIMVYAHDLRIRDETYPISSSYYSSWRRKIEEAAIYSPYLNSVVLRPGWVFGGTGGFFASLYFGKPTENITLYGQYHDRRYSWIHVDDLAASYVAAVRRIDRAKGKIFNIVNGYDNPTQVELFRKGTALAGFNGEIKWVEQMRGWQDETMDSNVVLKPSMAIDILEWTPKIFGLIDHLEFYYSTHKASSV